MLDDAIYSLKRPFHLVKTGLLNGLPAQIKYRFPNRKLKTFVITGTDGKTTSSTLLFHVMKTASLKVGLISTVGAYMGETSVDTGFHVTAPLPSQVLNFMKQMVDQKYKYLVLEATSHGIYQYRTWGIKPLVAGLTNISSEHLDYHLNYDNYVVAKSMLLREAKTAIINADDASYLKVKKATRKGRAKVLEYASTDVLPGKVKKAIQQAFPESFNQTNARLVYAMSQQIGISDQDFIKAISTFPGVPGRMESIPNQQHLNIIVDFAHTPQALEQALQNLSRQKNKDSRLIAVFGAAGLRDKLKRPAMTKVAVELADYVVLTAEDPRTEDVWSIIRQMKEELTTGHQKIISIADRQAALQYALTQLAKPGDTVGVFGKGHEQSMCFGTVEYPWSDTEAIMSILKTQPRKA